MPLPDLDNEQIFPRGIRVKALFDADCKWRLIEKFGTECFEEQAELLEPAKIREELRTALAGILRVYERDGGK